MTNRAGTRQGQRPKGYFYIPSMQHHPAACAIPTLLHLPHPLPPSTHCCAHARIARTPAHAAARRTHFSCCCCLHTALCAPAMTTCCPAQFLLLSAPHALYHLLVLPSATAPYALLTGWDWKHNIPFALLCFALRPPAPLPLWRVWHAVLCAVPVLAAGWQQQQQKAPCTCWHVSCLAWHSVLFSVFSPAPFSASCPGAVLSL